MDSVTDDLDSPAPQDETQELKKRVDELTNNWKRAVADYQNLQKRVEREREEFIKFSNVLLISKLLGLLDNLELSAKHIKDSGLDIVVGELKNIILEQGVKELEVEVGDPFDPNFQECVEVTHGEDDQKVVEVIAPGYIMEGRVIRPSKVKVSKKEPAAQPSPET